MPTIGTNVAITDEKGRILLTKREDFEVWCLPGGGVDLGESAAEAAIREAEEETGLKVRITKLVGVYYSLDKTLEIKNASASQRLRHLNTKQGLLSFKDRFKQAVFQREVRQNFKEI